MAKRRARAKCLVLDVGSSAIRLCELTPTKTGYQLSRYFQREIAVDPAADEDVRHDARLEALRTLLRDAKVRQRKVMFGVPGQSVFTRPRSLPPVPEHKLTQIVRYEIQQQIPFSLDQIALDYQVLRTTEVGGYDVLMAAIKVDVVEKQADIFRELKKQIHTVDVCPIAAYNWLKHTGEFGEEEDCVALIDMGASTTDIVIERENQFRFTRSLHMGGNEITAAVSSNFGMPFLEAEKVKRERGFAPTGDPQRDGKGGEVIGAVLNRLVTEIMRSFAYFRAQPGGGSVSRIILTGGGACLRNIVPFFQRQFNVEVRIAQPLAGLALAPGAQEVNEHPEQAAVVLGLALRACQPVPIEINLIPPRVLEASRRKEQIFYWALSLATLALIMASIIPVSANRDKQVQRHINTLSQRLAQYDPDFIPGDIPSSTSPYENELEQAESLLKANTKDLDALNSAIIDQTFWLNVLKAVNDARPANGVWIKKLNTTVLGDTQNAPRPSTVIAQEAATPAADGDAEGEQTQEQAQETVLPFASTGFYGITEGAGGGGATPRAIVVPNGVEVLGFATSPDIMMAYKENLEATGFFLENGVLLDHAFADRVPMSAMDGASRNVPGYGGYAAPENEVVQFRIYLQVRGGRVAPPEGS